MKSKDIFDQLQEAYGEQFQEQLQRLVQVCAKTHIGAHSPNCLGTSG
jgi:hypothetical protein